MRDLESSNVEAAAHLAREVDAGPGDDRPEPADPPPLGGESIEQVGAQPALQGESMDDLLKAG
jgi:hypothetical protein